LGSEKRIKKKERPSLIFLVLFGSQQGKSHVQNKAGKSKIKTKAQETKKR